MTDLLQMIAAYVPRSLVYHILGAVNPTIPTQADSQRLPAAVLFADISGFTSLTEMLAQHDSEGIEGLTRLLNDSYSWIIGLIEAEGGDVVQFSGDALTAVFPATTDSLAVATRRAQQAGESVQQAMGERGHIITSAGEVSLGMKVVIGAGDLLTVQVGGERGRWEYVVAGAPLRQIARLEKTIERGQVVLSPEAQAVVAHTAVLPRPLPIIDFADVAKLDVIEQILRCYVPGAVKNWLAESLHDWIGVLRPMSVLFINIDGLENDRGDIEVERLHHFFRNTQEMVYRYEGSINKLAVDDKGVILLVLFGAPPFAHEDDPFRAIRCAQDLQQLAKSQQVALSIGITTGRVFSGIVGSATRQEYTAMGDTVNVAARLMSHGQAGDIYCDYDTYRHVYNQVPLEALSPITVRGKVGQMRIYRPADSANAAMARQRVGRLFIGREAERETLQAYLDALTLGYGSILFVEGEAGIGKSRLVSQFMRSTYKAGVASLRGAGHSIQQQLSYWVWRDIFLSYFDLEEMQSMATRRIQVQQMVLSLVPEFEERLPLLNDILDIGLASTPFTVGLQGQTRHNSLVQLLIALLQQWAEKRPLVLVLEDAQWLDSLSWDLALQIARTFVKKPMPLLMLFVKRPLPDTNEKLPALIELKQLPATRRLQLKPFGKDETSTLAAARLGVPLEGVPSEVIDLIYERSVGNPFFVEELVYALQESGSLEIEMGVDGETPVACHVVETLQETAHTLPDTLQGLALSRIDRLMPEQQLTLKVASVIGRTFTYQTLFNTLHEHTKISEQLLQTHLGDFIKRELIVMEVPEPEPTYFFKHIMTREVAYETLLHTQRRQLHGSVARWYEREFGRDGVASTLSSYYPLLVHHWHQAGNDDQERLYTRLAGLKAADQYANEEALAYLSRALALTPAHQFQEHFELLLAREQIYYHQARRSQQAQDLEMLTQLADMLDSHQARAQVAWRLARLSELIGNYTTAERAAERGVYWAQLAEDKESEVRAYNQWATALTRQGYFEKGTELLQRALSIDEVYHDALHQARTLSSFAALYWHWGRYETALDYADRALPIFEKYADRIGEAACLNILGLIGFETHAFTNAIRYFEQALSLYVDIGERHGEANVYRNLGNVYLDFGDYEWAEAYYERAIAIDRETGDRPSEAVSLLMISRLHNDMGVYETAERYCEQSIAILEKIGDRPNKVIALATLSGIFYNRGRYMEAKAASQRGWQIRQEIDTGEHDLDILVRWGNALTALGEMDEAADKYERALFLGEARGRLAYRIYPLAGLAVLALAAGQLREAAVLAEEAFQGIVEHFPEAVQDMFGVYLVCYQVLRRVGQAQADTALMVLAQTVLQQGYNKLMVQITKIGDEDLREDVLADVVVYRQIVALVEG